MSDGLNASNEIDDKLPSLEPSLHRPDYSISNSYPHFIPHSPEMPVKMRAACLISIVALLATGGVQSSPTPRSTSSSSLLVVPNPPSSAIPDCLLNSYYGAYGGRDADHIYIPSGDCLENTSSLGSFSEGAIVPLSDLSNEHGRLVWVGHAGVEAMIGRDVREAWEGIAMRSGAWLKELSSSRLESEQTILSIPVVRPLSLVHSTERYLLLHVPHGIHPIIDTLLPSHLVPVALPTQAYPLGTTAPNGDVAMWEPVKDKYVKYLANITSSLKFDAKLDAVLNKGIEFDEVRRSIRWLSGEGPSGIESRHSFTPGALKAAHWIKDRVEKTGAECHFEHFLSGFAPNVICFYPTLLNSTDLVVISSHFDSRGSWGQTRAPGADDDGSGSGQLLAITEAIKNQNIHFEHQLVVAFFAGEEQGLLGSHAFAEKLHEKNASVLLHIQADMLGYHAPGEPLQLGLPESIHLPEASYLVGNVSQIYSPELVVGSTPACCSDHQSFVAYGFPATQVFERNGWIADPKYHNSGDLSGREGYDFEQIVSIAKVTLASAMTVAGYKLD